MLGLVTWQLKYDLLAVLALAAILLQTPDVVDPSDYAAILATAGIAASIFVGFRNTNAYQRWWEARTYGARSSTTPAMHNGLSAIDTESAAIAPVLDRMRRRQVRHAWQLAAQLRGRAAARVVASPRTHPTRLPPNCSTCKRRMSNNSARVVISITRPVSC